MKYLIEKLKLLFVMILISSICFGFSAFKILQSKTATNYVHSLDCQKEHYLELDCFDTCNGKQIHAQSQHHENAPVEVIIITSFDALIVLPLNIVSIKQIEISIPLENNNILFTSLKKGVFRPPLFA